MPFAQHSVKNFFPTPFIISTLEPAERDAMNAALIATIMQREQETAGNKISNAGGWQSDTAILDWGGAPVRQLVDYMRELLTDVTLILEQNVGLKRAAIDWRINGWANINRQGNANIEHDHPGAYWSAVYYVQTDPEETLGGELELLDPRGSLPLFYAPNLRLGIKGCTTAGTSELYKPEAGQCVIFPSWLRHAVTKSTGTGTRISLAFNFSV